LLQTIVGATRAVLTLCALGVALSACATNQPALNLPASALRSDSSGSGGDLLYVGGATNKVSIFNYPSGTDAGTFKAPGQISGMCSDGVGNVFIAANRHEKGGVAGYVYEYAHGGTTPIATLQIPRNELAVACSDDPTSANLAVTINNAKNFVSSVAIYASASKAPLVLKNRNLGTFAQPAYDDSGNLFVTSGSNVGAMLAIGSSALTTVTFDVTIGIVGHAQWDGTAFALQSWADPKLGQEKQLERIFRIQISGSTATVGKGTRYHNWRARDPGQSWIQGDTLVATPDKKVVFWKYPDGGDPFKTLHPATGAQAITVSVGSGGSPLRR
jgi:hypothetical protein